MLNACVDCGIKITGREGVQRCKRCWGITRRGVAKVPLRPCADCGKPLSSRSQAYRRPGGRCWDCHLKALATKKIRRCTVEGCTAPHMALGLCRNHYKAGRTKARGGPGSKNRVYRWAQQQPCQLCGYARQSSQVNRIDANEGYVAGNVTAVCSRCHGEITIGLSPHPDP